jgi:hypothetical protein
MSISNTTSRTYRFESELAARVSKMASKLGVSDNEYVNRSLNRSVIMDSLLQNIDGIGVSMSLFMELISQANPVKLEILGSEIASNNFALALDSLHLEMNASSAIHFMQVLQLFGWFKMETVSSQDHLDFVLYHKLNLKWSTFLKSLLQTMFQLVHERPEITISSKVLKMRFSKEASSWRSNIGLLDI